MLDLLKMFRDYSRSLEIQKLLAEEFHKEKVQRKKEKRPKCSLCTAAPYPQTKSRRETSSQLLFFFMEGGSQRSIFIDPNSLGWLADRIFSKWVDHFLIFSSHSSKLKEISADRWNRSQQFGECIIPIYQLTIGISLFPSHFNTHTSYLTKTAALMFCI